MKKISKYIIFIIVIVALIYQYGLPVFFEGCHIVLNEYFPASGTYKFNVENKLNTDIIVEIYNINDLPFKPESRHEQLKRLQFNQLTKTGVKLKAGSSSRISLPSMIDFAMGILIVVARTEINKPGGYEASQRLGIYILYPEDTLLKLRPNYKPVTLIVNSSNTEILHNGFYYKNNNMQHVALHRIIKEEFDKSVTILESDNSGVIQGVTEDSHP